MSNDGHFARSREFLLRWRYFRAEKPLFQSENG